MPPSTRAQRPRCAAPTRLDADEYLRAHRSRRRSRSRATASPTRSRSAARREPRRRSSAAPYGIVGDALVELGRYDEAFEAFDKMAGAEAEHVLLRARLLCPRADRRRRRSDRGDESRSGRRRSAGPRRPPGRAVELGKLEWSVGRIDRAAASFRLALAVVPGYAPALDALARVEHARGAHREGDRSSSARRSRRFPSRISSRQLGDLLAAAGRPAEAREQYDVVGAIERLEAANGVETDLETALFRIDHGIRLRESLRLARAARAVRPSVVGDDVLAWALARNGRCAEARVASERSLRLGQRDAHLLLPPRHDRALSRQRGCGEELVRPRSRPQPAFLDPLGAGRAEGRRVKRLARSSSPVSRRCSLPAAAEAHPLGNFTTNRYSELVVSGDRLYVRLRPRPRRDPDLPGSIEARAARTRGLRERSSRPRSARPCASGRPASGCSSASSSGGSRSRRASAVCGRRGSSSSSTPGRRRARGSVDDRRRDPRPGRLEGDRDPRRPGRARHRELGARESSTDRLRATRKTCSRARSTSRARGACSSREPSAACRRRSTASTDSAGRATTTSESGFAALVAEEKLSVGFVLVALLVAMFWGAAHALTPGHGKAIVAGYMVGSRGKPRHAFLLGGIVTVTHTIGVFALGLVTLGLSRVHRPRGSLSLAQPRLGAARRQRSG